MSFFSRLIDSLVRFKREREAAAEREREARTPGTKAWAKAQLAKMLAADESKPKHYVGALEYQGRLDEVLTYIEQRGTSVERLVSCSPRAIPCMDFIPARECIAYCVVAGPWTKWNAGDCYMVWKCWKITRLSRTTYGCKLEVIDVLD